MLLYSKLQDLLTNQTAANGKSPFNCKIFGLYGLNDKLRNVYFETENGVPCLLYIPSKYTVKMDTGKFAPLERWNKDTSSFGSVLTDDSDLSTVNKISLNSSPVGYINLVKKISQSIQSFSYKIAILSEEYLVVLYPDGGIDTFHIDGGVSETKLLIVIDIETLLYLNNFLLIEKLYHKILKLIEDDNKQYWENLLKILKVCHDKKIVSKGKLVADKTKIIDQCLKISNSYEAIKLALECYE
ncbi:034L [Cherax quadricarinatus iridovirus]|uniref:Uncharacterized protein n=1 Tax=Shrimp hemocyte iridescent virus TaxID=2039780 RepID=A0A291B0V5_9VIRU|nr:034L [Cherax quadricarinatus iridovirus]YP_010084869.1 hypothetical protein KM509_gp117 [Shrimp hemocyte iridescent virus]UPA43353.1 hypothetical protein 4TH000079 [Iridovirus CN01]ASZ85014.1 034L [Cherax quadricarinatus iridovirus]ATE87126.1 hypothetical protein [Shrimp hemocyte iridescent virus]UPA43588.1 hypothetical protein 3TG000155 [Iridovirus CN01]UPA43623.1 hypothetical protein 1DG000031 [Iridovirus CN01]